MSRASFRAWAALATLVSIACGTSAFAATPIDNKEEFMNTEQPLSTVQRAIAPIAAATAGRLEPMVLEGSRRGTNRIQAQGADASPDEGAPAS